MLADLKFVQGAVAVKDYQPALTHFNIRDGRVLGFNGTIALSSPIHLDITATPQAKPFVKAIERCKDETTVIHLTPAGKLALKSGGFKAYVDCTDETDILDGIRPEGDEVQVADNFVACLKYLAPFIGTDASRPWATGVLLRGYSAYATNNIVVAEYWLGQGMPEINLPSAAIAELIRIKEEPIKILMSENSVTFFFAKDRWMRTQILGLDWPDVSPLLERDSNLVPFPADFFEAVETITPFVKEEGRIYFREGYISTSPEEGEGASIEIEGLPSKGAFHHKHLLSLNGVAEKIDFTHHPQPCPFQGSKLRGIILGMRDEG
jgi:hypothetical protein